MDAAERKRKVEEMIKLLKDNIAWAEEQPVPTHIIITVSAARTLTELLTGAVSP